MTVWVRRLRVGDEHFVQAALQAWDRPAEELVARMFLADPGVVAIGALWGTEIVGLAYGYVLPRPDVEPMAQLYSVDVWPDWRRQGIGRRLVEEFVATCGPVSTLWVMTSTENLPAKSLYAALGAAPREVAQVYQWARGSDPGLSLR